MFFFHVQFLNLLLWLLVPFFFYFQTFLRTYFSFFFKDAFIDKKRSWRVFCVFLFLCYWIYFIGRTSFSFPNYWFSWKVSISSTKMFCKNHSNLMYSDYIFRTYIFLYKSMKTLFTNCYPWTFFMFLNLWNFVKLVYQISFLFCRFWTWKIGSQLFVSCSRDPRKLNLDCSFPHML